MKILYILPYDWAGMPHYTAELANAVSKYEDVTVVGSRQINENYYNDNVKIIKLFKPIDFSTSYVKTLQNLNNVLGLLSFYKIRKIDTIKPDVIHFTTPILPPLPLFIRLFQLDKRYRIVYTKHSILTDRRLRIRIFEIIEVLLELILNYAKWIVHTDYDKKMLIEKMHVKKDEVEIIPHGAYSFFKSYGSDTPLEKNTILFFGRIVDYKGLGYLLDAIPILVKEIPDIKVVIAGEGDISPYIHKLNKLDSKNVTLINEYIEDKKVSELFLSSELVVIPYTNMTGQSGILNIACAFNKPVIVTDVGGLGSILEDGKNGFLIPAEDADAIARSVIKILKNDCLKASMITNMKKKSEALSWDRIAKMHINVYTEVIRPGSN